LEVNGPMEWVVAVAVVAVVAVILFAMARRSRRRGGERSGSDIWKDVREFRRDAETPRIFMDDPSWTHRGRTRRP
jgi:hypothetical protein